MAAIRFSHRLLQCMGGPWACPVLEQLRKVYWISTGEFHSRIRTLGNVHVARERMSAMHAGRDEEVLGGASGGAAANGRHGGHVLHRRARHHA